MESALVYLSSVVVLGMTAQLLSWHLRIPSILLLLGFGFGLGYVVRPDKFIEQDLLFSIVSLSVAVVLFEGGLTLRFSELRESGPEILRLVTLGAIVTWGLGTLAARIVFSDFGLAALAGAIFTVTGPTVIVPLLRHIRPSKRVGAIAKWEGIVIDPVGALLAIITFEVLVSTSAQQAAAHMVLVVIKTIVFSSVIGIAAACIVVQLMKRHWLPDYLENPVLLAFVLAVYAISDELQAESGLATVTIFGIALANQRQVAVEHFVQFKESLGVLLIAVLFVLLSSRMPLGDLTALGWPGIVFIGVLIVVVRPASIGVATWRSSLSWQERGLLCGLAPRGIVAAAVASVFSLELSALTKEGHIPAEIAQQAELLTPLTFLVIVSTVAIYGLSAAPLARRLGLADSNPQGVLFAGSGPFARAIARVLKAEGYEVALIDSSYRQVSAARMEGLRARKANILSEYLQDDLELAGIGRFLAMTPNDEVNALAALEFQRIFGKRSVFRLASPTTSTSEQGELAVVAPNISKTLFSPGMTYSVLEKRLAGGAVIKKTPLSDEFNFDEFLELYGDSAVVLFVIDSDGRLSVQSAKEHPSPKSGQTLISMVDQVADSDRES